VLLSGRHQRRVAWPALFAVWLQVAVVFPHICPDDIAALGGSLAFGPEIVSGASDAPDLPLCPLSDGRGGDTCFIYAAAHLAGAPLLPDAIRVDPPARSGARSAAREAPMLPARRHRLLFETRAPPVL
jgi:hypothetical protein